MTTAYRAKPVRIFRQSAIWNWLVIQWQWPSATLFAALSLLAIFPVVIPHIGPALALVLIQLPIYMLHQWEEHAGDRFRQYVNRVIARGQEALTPAATFWINCLGVWAVDLLAAYLATALGPAAGLAAGYLAVVNSLLHIGPAVARRQYNPGLATACLLLLPFGIGCLAVAGKDCGWQPHAIGLAVALLVHLAVVAQVALRLSHRALTPATE